MDNEFEMTFFYEENHIHAFVFKKQGELLYKWVEIETPIIIKILEKLTQTNITEDIRKIIFEKIKKIFDEVNLEITIHDNRSIDSDTEYEWDSEEWPDSD